MMSELTLKLYNDSVFGGINDVEDSGELIKKSLKELPVDPERVYLYGYSHGRFISAWLTCH